nr:MAG TPA: hypothetical protein [Caudoviricetes sp.]
MGILENIDSAAYDLELGRLGELTPVARNFTIVRDMPHENCISTYRVFSYETVVMHVCKRFDNELLILLKPNAFHSTTTSKHVRRCLSALIGRVDWDAPYKACDRECNKETISGNGARFINVREVA